VKNTAETLYTPAVVTQEIIDKLGTKTNTQCITLMTLYATTKGEFVHAATTRRYNAHSRQSYFPTTSPLCYCTTELNYRLNKNAYEKQTKKFSSKRFSNCALLQAYTLADLYTQGSRSSSQADAVYQHHPASLCQYGSATSRLGDVSPDDTIQGSMACPWGGSCGSGRRRIVSG